MTVQTMEELVAKKCTPCEGKAVACSVEEAQDQLSRLEGWRLTRYGTRIRKEWAVKDFAAGMQFLRKVADLAQTEDHHPDIHLEGYRNVSIELTTHAIAGLSENDFILAAKIDALPVKLKR